MKAGVNVTGVLILQSTATGPGSPSRSTT